MKECVNFPRRYFDVEDDTIVLYVSTACALPLDLGASAQPIRSYHEQVRFPIHTQAAPVGISRSNTY